MEGTMAFTRSLRHFPTAKMNHFAAFHPEKERSGEATPKGCVIHALGFRVNPMKKSSESYSESALSSQKFAQRGGNHGANRSFWF
jgi:hypothetical protein